MSGRTGTTRTQACPAAAAGWRFGLCILLLLTSGALRAADKEKVNWAKLRHQEKKRVDDVMTWVFKTKPPPNAIFVKMYEPIGKANEKQRKDNIRLAKRFLENGQRAEDRGDDKKATLLYTVAKLFKRYADDNQRIAKGVAERNHDEVEAAFEDIKKIEQHITKLTGRKVTRKWFMSDELDDVVLDRAPRTAKKESSDGGKK